MRAVVCTDFESSEVREVESPTPGPGEAVIEVARVQLSVTECLLYRGVEIAHYDEVAERLRKSNDGVQLFGHEFCGRIADVDENVDEFAVGDRVYAPGKIPCGACPYCRSNHRHLCADVVSVGYERPGALAEYIRLPTEPLCRLPDGVSDAEGAAMQPMASSVLCAMDADIEPGDVVAVVGAGVMGIQCAQLAAEFGAKDVYAIDVRDQPLHIAAARGLVPVDATAEDPVETVRAATDSVGADVVFEAVGGEQNHATDGDGPLAQAFSMVRRGGTIVQVGHITGETEMTPRVARSKSVRWINPLRGVVSAGPNRNNGELAAELVARGDVSIDEFVTHELDRLDEFEKAVDITLNKGEYGALGPAQLVLKGA